ncbi:MAG: hypothetical protein VX044_02450 [Planctomycetota bacterium]|nr:hypothetical protein [Planctomycetota bacterium]MEE2835310.1 hypothetical protein [Myxococcota bacterium]
MTPTPPGNAQRATPRANAAAPWSAELAGIIEWIGKAIGVALPAAGEFLIELRYSSAAGGTLQLEEGGGSPLYSLLELPATSGWQTHAAVVDLSAAPGVITPALAFAPASAGPVTVNWVRITDLSTAMQLTATGGPVLGSTWTLDAAGLDTSALAALFWFGDVPFPSGLSLAVLGGEGCFSYTSANLATLLAPASGGVSSYGLLVPASANLTGFELSVQASAGSSSVPMGFVTSNGLLGRVGL